MEGLWPTARLDTHQTRTNTEDSGLQDRGERTENTGQRRGDSEYRTEETGQRTQDRGERTEETRRNMITPPW